MISYACGSTFGTMGIVFPLVGPLAWRLGEGDVDFLHHCFGCILGASLFGSVCSPISDTTILTSLATGEILTKNSFDIDYQETCMCLISLLFTLSFELFIATINDWFKYAPCNFSWVSEIELVFVWLCASASGLPKN